MKVKLLFISTMMLVLFFSKANAQEKQFSLAPVIAIPTGTLGLFNSTGFGATLTFEKEIDSKLNFFAETGFISFGDKGLGSASHIPVQLGVKYYQENFFLGLGIGTSTYKYGKSGDEYFDETDKEASTGFAITPQLGYKMGKLDLNVSYSASSVGDPGDKQPYNYLAIKAMFKIF
jgi:hypothetical protein